MVPLWLHQLSLAMLLLGAACAVVIAADELRDPQRMWIMNVVWPVCALFGGVLVLAQYFRYGRRAAGSRADAAGRPGEAAPQRSRAPFPIMVANGALHCGSGCTLGDIAAEWLILGFPLLATIGGWHWLFGQRLFADWAVDYGFAFAFGIVFQYFTIAPMRGLGLGPGLLAAVKADTLSLSAWQLGMYGFMAFAHFVLFGRLLHAALRPDSVAFWFMMQIAMLCGFVTTYPVNWLLLRTGIKEAM